MAALLGASLESPSRWPMLPRRAKSTIAMTMIRARLSYQAIRERSKGIGMAKEKGARRAVLLPVSAPFHCPLMQPAAEAMERALADARLEPPTLPIFANVTASPEDDPDRIRILLVEQVTGRVRWRESVEAMVEAGVTHFVEYGAKVLGPMVKRIAPDATVTSVVTPDDIDALLKEI